jgi:hypothetical protein
MEKFLTRLGKFLSEESLVLRRKTAKWAAVLAAIALTGVLAAGCIFKPDAPTEPTQPATSAPTEPIETEPTEPPLVPANGVPEGSEEIFTVTLSNWRSEGLITTDEPHYLQMLPDKAMEITQGNICSAGARLCLKERCPENAYLRIELYGSAWSADGECQEMKLIAAAEEPLNPNMQSISAIFRLDTTKLDTYIHEFRLFLCEADGTVLASGKSAEVTLEYTHNVALYSLDGMPLDEITWPSNNAFDCHLPYYVEGYDVYTAVSNPDVARIETLDTEEGKLYTIYTLDEGDATLTFTYAGYRTDVTLHVDDSIPFPANRRFPGMWPSEHYQSGAFSVRDAAGNDITADLVDLWFACNAVCEQDNYLLFAVSDRMKFSAMSPDYMQLDNYEKVVDSVYTTNGHKQLEQAKTGGQLVFETRYGNYYRMLSWKYTYYYSVALHSMEAKEAEENRLVLSVQYQTNADTVLPDEPEATFDWVDFTVVKEDGVWKVENYCYPDFAY